MDFLVSPAALVAVISGVALAAWAVGRWQGEGQPLAAEASVPISADRIAAAAQAKPAVRVVTPLPREQISRADTLDSKISLADLHDEISAFRQTERVFATLARDSLCFDRLPVDQQTEFRRNNGVTAPASAAHAVGEGVCACGDCSGPLRRARSVQAFAAQPSPGWLSLSRV